MTARNVRPEVSTVRPSVWFTLRFMSCSRGSRREPLDQLINRSVNQTLGRTVMTSGLTFLTVIALYLFGGQVLHGFSFALVVGIIIGTYSSVFIASPIILFWHDWFDKRKKSSAVLAPAKVAAVKEPVRKGSVRAVK